MATVLFWIFVAVLLVAVILWAESLAIEYKKEAEWDESGRSHKQRRLDRGALALAVIGVGGILALVVIYGF